MSVQARESTMHSRVEVLTKFAFFILCRISMETVVVFAGDTGLSMRL
jgi:hypothetical protein